MDSVNDGGRKPTTKFEGGSDEAARLLPQQRGLPGPNRVKSKGPEGRAPAASPSQGRTARSVLSRDQPARVGADPAGPWRDHFPVSGDHRMAGRDSPRAAAVTERSAAARAGPCI